LSIASDSVAMFRTEWADRLVDVCTIWHPVMGDNRGAINPTTLQYPAPESPIVTGVACLARPSSEGEDSAVLFGQEARTFSGVDVYTAFDLTSEVDLDDEVELTSSVNEPLFVGKRLIIRSITHDSYNTRRRLRCELDLGSGLEV
jgi:hypothetical protein